MLLPAALGLLMTGCSALLPTSGPSSFSVRHSGGGTNGIRVVDLTLPMARLLYSHREPQLFSEAFSGHGGASGTVRPGDVLAVTITEAPPASLFSGPGSGTGTSTSTVQSINFPEQMISEAGTINIPFAGQVSAAGKSLSQIEDEITQRLKEKANQPQVLVRLTSNNTDYVTVLGAVAASARLPLTPGRERVLDALAKGGGNFDDVNKVTVQITRHGRSLSMPMGAVIRDPSQNLVLEPGDVITVLNRPLGFTAMGATGRSEELKFEGPSITLAQAVARAGGLIDDRANATGVFLFRFESKEVVDGKARPTSQLPGDKIPVVYCVNLAKPSGLFVARTFPVNDGDILYVANAPAAELRKFLEIIGTIAAPVANATNTAVNAEAR